MSFFSFLKFSSLVLLIFFFKKRGEGRKKN